MQGSVGSLSKLVINHIHALACTRYYVMPRDSADPVFVAPRCTASNQLTKHVCIQDSSEVGVETGPGYPHVFFALLFSSSDMQEDSVVPKPTSFNPSDTEPEDSLLSPE